VRCVDGTETIEDELEDDGLSTVSISTSFSENSIRGSNDVVLLIFSGMRAIRWSEYGGGTSMTWT
jgi:hypothetical protein